MRHSGSTFLLNGQRFVLKYYILRRKIFGYGGRIFNYEKIKGSKIQNFEFFEVIALYIRLVEMAITLKTSATEIGMKDSTKEKLMKLKTPFKELFVMIYQRTGIKLPQIEKIMLGGLEA